MRRLWASWMAAVVAAVFLLAALAPPASASIEWCSADPAVVVRTPGGNVAVVHVTLYAEGAEHRAALRDATITYTALPAAGGEDTAVEIEVVIPHDRYPTGFATRAVASTLPFERGAILDTAGGRSGRAMQLSFRLDVP